MSSGIVPEAAILAHDMMLLARPHTQAMVLAYLAAGTHVRPLHTVDGFFAIQHKQHYGFLPALLCSSSTTAALDTSGSRLTLEQPALVWPSLAASAAVSPPLPAVAGEQLLVLGQDAGWLFVQRHDGGIGFLAPAQVAAQEARWTGPRVGCMLVMLWMAAGWGWAGMNWLGMQLLLRLVIFLPRWQTLLEWLVGLGVFVAMWRGPSRDPARLFLVGVFIQVMIVAMIVFFSLFI
jgi:hypothetical protein